MCKTLCFHRKDGYIKHFYTKHAFIDNSGTAKCLLKMHEVCGHGRYCFYYQYKYIFQYTEVCIEYETGFLEFWIYLWRLQNLNAFCIISSKSRVFYFETRMSRVRDWSVYFHYEFWPPIALLQHWSKQRVWMFGILSYRVNSISDISIVGFLMGL